MLTIAAQLDLLPGLFAMVAAVFAERAVGRDDTHA
jgi:hypothetical protein